MSRRPLSPHLQIYKIQITSALSITHRMTGLFLALGLVVFVLWLLCAILGDDEYAVFYGVFSSFFGEGLLFLWGWSLFFHLLNGIRHLFWDCGYGFDLKIVHRSGWFVFGGSLVLTALTWVFACKVGV